MLSTPARRPAAVLLVVAVALAGGCSSKLRCEPEPFVHDAKLLSADYTMLDNKLMVEVNTDGYRIDQIWIAMPDGTQLKANQIEYQTGGGGSGFGVGVGGGSGGVGGGVGVGTGGGSGHISGITKVFFDNAGLGSPPWPLHVKLMGLPRTVITLTPKPQ